MTLLSVRNVKKIIIGNVLTSLILLSNSTKKIRINHGVVILVEINIVKTVIKLFQEQTLKVSAAISVLFGFTSAALNSMKMLSIISVITLTLFGLAHHVYGNFVYLAI